MTLTLFLPVEEERTFPDGETNWKFKFIEGVNRQHKVDKI
jgi:hypothetical protein